MSPQEHQHKRSNASAALVKGSLWPWTSLCSRIRACRSPRHDHTNRQLQLSGYASEQLANTVASSKITVAMADTAAPLPPGSYDNGVPMTIGVTILCLSIASAVVVLRTYTRGWIINQMGVDDYFAIASLLMVYGTGIAILSSAFSTPNHKVLATDIIQ